MKNALIITTISGFLTQFEKNDVKLLQQLGYKVHYASNFDNPVYVYDAEELKSMGIITHKIDIQKSPSSVIHNVKAYRQVKKIISECSIDLIHCHNPMGGVIGRLAGAASRNKPYIIYTAHGFHFYDGAPLKNWILYHTVEKFLARRSNTIITINDEDLRHAGKFKLRNGGNVEKIPGVGVDLGRFRARPELKKPMRKKLGVPENAFHIVSVAELNDNKNHKVMIDAIAKLGKKDIYYSVCGKGTKAGELKDYIKRMQLEKQIRLFGFRTDIPDVLQSADCFAFPSIREGLGIAAIEALACEVPLIVLDNRGTREYAKHMVNGIVCMENEVQSFEKAILELYQNRELLMLLREDCRLSAEKFSKECTDTIMRKIYRMADETKR